jgi:hypothetical protein
MAWQKCHKVGGYTKPPASPKLIPSVAAPPPALGVRSRDIEGAQGGFVIRSVVVGGHVRNMEPRVGGRTRSLAVG